MVSFLFRLSDGGGGGGKRGKGEMGRKGGVVYGVVRLVKVQLLEKAGFINSPFWHCASSEASGHSATPLHTCSFLMKSPLEQPNTSFKALS